MSVKGTGSGIFYDDILIVQSSLHALFFTRPITYRILTHRQSALPGLCTLRHCLYKTQAKKKDFAPRTDMDKPSHPDVPYAPGPPVPAGTSSSADGVSHVGNLHILVCQVITAQLKYQRFYMLAKPLLRHFGHNLCHR